MSDEISDAILELDHLGDAVFTKPGVFDCRHLAEPVTMPQFWDGDVPDFRLACRGGLTVDPEAVDVLEEEPDGLCERCDGSMAISLLRGPIGSLEGD